MYGKEQYWILQTFSNKYVWQESTHQKRQAFGQCSKQSLSDMAFNKTVQVETAKRDRYGREIGKILVNGVDLNLEQVKRGFA